MAMGWPDWADPVPAKRLRDTIRDGRIGHAYLLAGPKGVGKSALATAFAQAMCCTSHCGEDRSQPCLECRACRNVARRVHPDVEWFDLETQALMADKGGAQASLSIETVRRLRASAALYPLEAERRIIVVDDAETLLEPAQQAFLKTLEEPPPKVTILLLSDDGEALLDTVRSRAQEVAVQLVPEAAIARSLASRGVDDSAATEIAKLSRGAPAWAIAAATNNDLLRSRQAERNAALAWLNSGAYERLTTAFTLGEQFGKRRGEVLGIVLAAVQEWRERMIHAAGAALDSDVAMPGELPVAALGRAVTASLRCLSDLDANVRPRLALETMVVQWPTLDPSLE
jgi:DNA polymerase-3 subunit delta'